MSDHRRRLEEYIKASDQRVEKWSEPRKAAFEEAVRVMKKSQNSDTQPLREPPEQCPPLAAD